MKPETMISTSTAPTVVMPIVKRETVYQRLKRLSKEIQLRADDPKFAWPND